MLFLILHVFLTWLSIHPHPGLIGPPGLRDGHDGHDSHDLMNVDNTMSYYGLYNIFISYSSMKLLEINIWTWHINGHFEMVWTANWRWFGEWFIPPLNISASWFSDRCPGTLGKHWECWWEAIPKNEPSSVEIPFFIGDISVIRSCITRLFGLN